MEKSMGVTHHQFDFDGGSCLRFLERKGAIQGCIFGEKELEVILSENKISKLFFVDYSPRESIPGIGVVIYDHHLKNNAGEQNKTNDKTAFDILIDSIGVLGFDQAKIDKWRELVMLSDKKAESDDMDMSRALKRVHTLLDSDIETYTKWFVPVFDSFFANEPNLEYAIKVLQEEISEFISDNPDSLANIFLQRWLGRSQDKERISRSTMRNIVHFLAYMGKDVAKDWIRLLLKGYDKEQVEFQECKADFNKVRVDFYGNTLIISAITKSFKFVQVARYMIFSKDQNINPLIREKIKDQNSPWLTVLVNPKNKNFQIFVNGNKILIHRIIEELIKAIRAEILLRRNRLVPDFNVLSREGVIEGTEPLYFHKLKTGYPSILWGSLKHPVVAAAELGNTSAEIHSRLIEIVKLALDENEYPANCNPISCKDCSICPWQLKKCHERRKMTERKK